MTPSIIDAAIRKFIESTGILASYNPDDEFIGFQFDILSKTTYYKVEVLDSFDRLTAVVTTNNRYFDKKSSVIVTRYMSEDMARVSKMLGLQFIDTAGNAYLNNNNGLCVQSYGRPEVEDTYRDSKRFRTPASINVLHSFLVSTPLLNAPIGAIATASKMSLGTAAEAVHALEHNKVIERDTNGMLNFTDRNKAIDDWAVNYASILRPQLRIRRFKTMAPSLLNRRPELPEGAKWGSEVAAKILNNYYFLTRSFTVYADFDDVDLIDDLVTRFKLAPNKNGNFEIVEQFWRIADASLDQVVPPILVYADLLASKEPRSIEMSTLLLDRIKE